MIIKPLNFVWSINSEKVEFSVTENKAYTIHKKYYSDGKIPPITERVEYMRLLGASESDVKKMVKDHIQWNKNSQKNQEEIDNIFLRFNVKPMKKKMLKPVKKN